MNLYLEGANRDDVSGGAHSRPLPERWAPFLLSALRVIAAFLFVAHGTQKLFAFPVSEPRPPVDFGSLMGLAGVIEFVGGTLLLLGLFSRPVAFILSGEMAVAYFLRHAPRGFWPALNGGELAALYCFIFLFVAAAGPGAWSLDSLRQSRRVRSQKAAHKTGGRAAEG
jgi:putative oxidoreductase